MIRWASENEPTDPKLWEKVQELTKGERDSLTVGDKTVQGPNDGKGFKIFPSAYCVPMGSEALTRQGWKTFGELELGEDILAYDIARDVLDWAPVQNLHYHPKAPTVRLKKQSLDIVCTPEHRWLYFRNNHHATDNVDRERMWELIREIQSGSKKVSHVIRDEVPGFQHWWDKYRECSTYQEFLLSSGRGGLSLVSTQELSLEGKLLVAAPYVGGDGSDWRFKVKYRGSWLERLLEMTPEALESFYAACVMCDGWQLQQTANHGFSQKDPDHADAFELCAFLTGRRVRRRFDPDRGLSVFTVNSKRHIPLPGTRVKDAGEQPVWCPETRFGTWVMRQNGHVMITGNSNGWASKVYKEFGGGWRKKKAADGAQHVGVFAPLPEDLASQFPSKAEDSSRPHVTLCYIGDVDPEDEAKLVGAVTAFYAKERGPVKARLGEVDYFQNPDGRVAYCKVLFSTDMGAMKDRLKSHLEDQGFEFSDSHPLAFNPHVTLAYYDDPHQNWDGDVPTGAWSFDEVEVWGFPETHRCAMAAGRAASLEALWAEANRRLARGNAKKDVGHGGLDEWFSGHDGEEGDATWGDWIAITPVKHTVETEDGKKKTYEPGDIVGPCGISTEPEWKDITNNGKDPLKCMPRDKAHDLGKKERAEEAKEKYEAEKADKNTGKKPTRTRTFGEGAD